MHKNSQPQSEKKDEKITIQFRGPAIYKKIHQFCFFFLLFNLMLANFNCYNFYEESLNDLRFKREIINL